MATNPAKTDGTENSWAAQARPLAGRHAVVTGASRGIGWAIADYLAGMGADLTLMARDAGRLDARREDLAARHGISARAEAADITDADSVAAAFAACAAWSPVSILINNAGAAGSAPFLKTDADLLDRMLAVNLTGTFVCTQQVLPGMIESGWGRVVNVASTAGLTGYRYVSAYCAAKHAVVGMTRSLALEVAGKGVTVNAVCPGYTETDLVGDAVANIVAKTGKSEEEAKATLAAGNPQGRLVQPEEVAAAVGWLCLPESAAVTGQAVAVAGGEVM